MADLEAKLAELTHYLESAETRASEVLFLTAQARELGALVDAKTSELAAMTERVRQPDAQLAAADAQLAAATEASARCGAALDWYPHAENRRPMPRRSARWRPTQLVAGGLGSRPGRTL
jgi:Tfp pilus assembly protein FimV